MGTSTEGDSIMEAIRLNGTNTVERLHTWTTEELLTARVHALARLEAIASDIETLDEELGRREYEAC
jgi:hypothetical protein